MLQFLSSYRGQASFMVMRGELKGRRIFVRYLSLDWYRQDYESNVGRIYGVDLKHHTQEILQSVGLVCSPGLRVVDAVVRAVNEFYGPLQASQPERYFQGIFVPGRYVTGEGWVPDLELPTPGAADSAAAS